MTLLLSDLQNAQPDIRSAYHADVLSEAEIFCLEGLAGDPEDASLLNLRGLLAARAGEFERAIAFLSRAVERCPRNPAYLCDLGSALDRFGGADEAVQCYAQALSLMPENARVHAEFAQVLRHMDRLGDALAACERALALDTTRAATYAELGDCLRALGRLDDARLQYERAIAFAPSTADLYQRLGELFLNQGSLTKSCEVFSTGLRHAPRRVDLHVGLGEGLLRQGLITSAIAAFRAALAIEPRDVSACRQLVMAVELLGRRLEAADAWWALGTALDSKGRFDEAALAYRETLNRKPDHLSAHVGLGHVEAQRARPHEALNHFAAGLAIEPEHDTVHLGLAKAAAMTGDLQRTWDELAWYEQWGHSRRRYFEQPPWDGESLDGRTILLWSNFPPGETIQFMRLAYKLKEQGARIMLECERTLIPVFQRLPYIDRIVGHKTPLPPFDVHAPLTSLPLRLRPDVRTLSANAPCLTMPAGVVDRWRRRLGRWPNIDNEHRQQDVGLVWANDSAAAGSSAASIPLTLYEPLATVSGVRFVSLQTGAAAVDIYAPPRQLHITRALTKHSTVDDLAALIVTLDLVITVDTMVAHLAGALGRPVWVLLPFVPGYLWLAEHDRTPWYPTMRLFQQHRRGDWSDVLARVREALEHWTRRPTDLSATTRSLL